MSRGPPYRDRVSTIPRLRNSTDIRVGTFKTNLQGKQDGSGKGTCLQSHDLSSDFHMLIAACKPMHTLTHIYECISRRYSQLRTTPWNTVNTIQILRDSTKQVTKTICRAEYTNLETFFFFFAVEEILLQSVFCLCGGRRTSSGISVLLPSCL